MSPYTPHAQLVTTEMMVGRLAQPSPEELEKIEAYRAAYQVAFGREPAGTHWVDGLDKLVLLRRAGGLPIERKDALDGGGVQG